MTTLPCRCIGRLFLFADAGELRCQAGKLLAEQGELAFQDLPALLRLGKLHLERLVRRIECVGSALQRLLLLRQGQLLLGGLLLAEERRTPRAQPAAASATNATDVHAVRRTTVRSRNSSRAHGGDTPAEGFGRDDSDPLQTGQDQSDSTFDAVSAFRIQPGSGGYSP
jgi:hypothetical protein